MNMKRKAIVSWTLAVLALTVILLLSFPRQGAADCCYTQYWTKFYGTGGAEDCCFQGNGCTPCIVCIDC